MSSWGGGSWGETPWGGEVYTSTALPHPTVSISGADRPYLVVQSAEINWPKRGRKTARFSLFDRDQLYVPVVGAPVILTDGGTTFRGIIVAIRQTRAGGVLDYIWYHCECSDYAAIFDHRFVARRYPAGSIAKNVILDICQNFLLQDGFDTAGVDGFTTISDELAFDYRSVTECFNTISDLTGEDWWVGGSDGKALYFRSLANAPAAPMPLSDTSANWRDLEVHQDTKAYRNRQYLRAGTTLQTGTITETFTGDGLQWLFPTRFVLNAAPTVTVNGTPQTVYQMGVDAYPAAGWFWIPGGGGVQEGTQTAPGAGASIIVQYGSYSSSVVTAEDTAEQAVRAAIEGGSGIWESVEDARDVDNLSTAQALVAALLARHMSLPADIVYETDWPGMEPGQAQAVGPLAANGIELLPGSELVTNGGFSSGASWTLGSPASISSGHLIIPGNGSATQDIGIADNKQYRVTYVVESASFGNILIQLGGSIQEVDSTVGTHSVDFTITTASDPNVVIGGVVFSGEIDSISVKELLPQSYYVTEVTSKDIGAPFPGTGYFFRHRVTLSSVRDQGDWLNWWLNFYRQGKSFATGSAALELLQFKKYDGTVI